MDKSLDDLLEEIVVWEAGTWENELSELMPDWFAVSNDEGIISYFGNKVDAFRFRLDYINRIMNP